METKMGYNGYSANTPPTWSQEPQYGHLNQSYQQPYQPYQQQYPAQPPAQFPPPQPGYSQSSMPAWGLTPQSHPRSLEVSFTSWSGRHMRITEGTHEGPLVYAADLKTRRPHMLFQATGTARLPATVVFHNFSRTIDITINGEELPMRPTSHWKHEYGFNSRALQGKHLTWKRSRGWTRTNLECVDENGAVFAKWIAHSGWSVKKSGRLEIYEPAAVGEKKVADELVVTGLANVYLLQMQTKSANAAAGSASAVSA
ncbi:hypothetical protein BDW60DRAFT_188482 [Aspergillus nidulans var. acristatus]